MSSAPRCRASDHEGWRGLPASGPFKLFITGPFDRTAMGSQPPATNIRHFSPLALPDPKNRTDIGSHPGAGKNHQNQADLPAMSGGLNLDKSDSSYGRAVQVVGSR